MAPWRSGEREGDLMQLSDNTILITGGGRGIGRGLAEALHAEGNQVIIAGRGKKALEETVSANPGMKAAELDMTDGDAIVRFAGQMKRAYPALNAVRSEEHTSELQSPCNLVCRLLLEKKN